MTSIAGMLLLQLDKVMITGMIGENSTAIYALAIYIATIIEVPKRAINQTLVPIISEAWKNNDMKLLKKVYNQTSINQQLAGILLLSLFWIQRITQIF